MSDQETDDRGRTQVSHYSTVSFFREQLLSWRLWAMSGMLVVPFILSSWAFNFVSPGIAVLVGIASGIWVGGALIKLSPKYNVTKNY